MNVECCSWLLVINEEYVVAFISLDLLMFHNCQGEKKLFAKWEEFNMSLLKIYLR